MRTVWLASDHDFANKGSDQDYVHFVADDLKSFLSSLSMAA
jgi:putative hydrolase of the HAD superfamily